MSKHIEPQIYKADAVWPKKCIKAVIPPAEELRRIALKRSVFRGKCGHSLPRCSADSSRSSFAAKNVFMNFIQQLKLLSQSSSSHIKAVSFCFYFSHFITSLLKHLLKSKTESPNCKVSLKTQILFFTECWACIT